MAEPTQFPTRLNNVNSLLGASHTAGQPTITVSTGHGTRFGSPSPTAPVVVSVDHPSGARVIYRCTGVVGDVLTVAVYGSGPDAKSDINIPLGAKVALRWTAGAAKALDDAVNAAEGVVYDAFADDGSFSVAGGGMAVDVDGAVAATKSLSVAMMPSQTDDPFTITDASDAVVFKVDVDGNATLPPTDVSGNLTVKMPASPTLPPINVVNHSDVSVFSVSAAGAVVAASFAGDGSAVTGVTQAHVTGLTAALAAKADDSNTVHKTGAAQTVDAATTFNSRVTIAPAAATTSLTIKQAPSATAAPLNVTDSSDVSVFAVDAAGNLSVGPPPPFTLAGLYVYGQGGDAGVWTHGNQVQGRTSGGAANGDLSLNPAGGNVLVGEGAGVTIRLNSDGSATYAGAVTAPTLYGGSTAAADLHISSTSHSTKGNVYLYSTTTLVDGLGQVGVGIAPNIAGVSNSNYRTVTIVGVTTNSSEGAGRLELATQQTDADAALCGFIDFVASAHSPGSKRVAAILSFTDGSAAANRGGNLVFYTKADGGGLAERMAIDEAGAVAIMMPPSASESPLKVVTSSALAIFEVDAAGGVALGPAGVGLAVRADGVELPPIADAGAANRRLYFSTDAGKPCFKDDDGFVHPLF